MTTITGINPIEGDYFGYEVLLSNGDKLSRTVEAAKGSGVSITSNAYEFIGSEYVSSFGWQLKINEVRKEDILAIITKMGDLYLMSYIDPTENYMERNILP